MKISGNLVIILCSLFCLSGIIYAEEDTAGKRSSNRFTGGPFKTTEKGLFKVAVISTADTFIAGNNTADIIVHDNKGMGVSGAKIVVTPWMRKMEHGSPVQPEVTEKGGGMFRAENIFFNMGGYWELRIKIIKDGVEDKIVFIFPDISEN